MGEEMRKLEYLSLVSKVASELENHLGIGDKTLAEARRLLLSSYPSGAAAFPP